MLYIVIERKNETEYTILSEINLSGLKKLLRSLTRGSDLNITDTVKKTTKGTKCSNSSQLNFLSGLGHELNIKIKQGTVCESNERKGVHFNDFAVYQCKDHFNADHEKPCCHKPVSSGIRFLGRDQQTCEKGLRDSNI